MKSYLGSTELKEKFVQEIKWHEKQDKFLQGTYSEGSGENFKGCAVGCSIKSLNRLNGTRIQTNNHKAYEKYLGIPEWLARLEDTIFEGLSVEEAKKWPLKFSKAIPVGADLEPVKWKFCAYLMKENIARVKQLDLDTDLKNQVLDAIKAVKQLNERAAKTGGWDESAAESARSAAWSARSAAESAAESAAWSARSAAWSAWSAAWSAAESAARSAAWSAAESAAWSARSAAWSAWSAAWSAAYTKHSKKLLALLKEAQS